MGTDQFIRIGVVSDDVAGAGYGNRFDGVWGNPDGPGQLHRAVFVGVFEANIQDRRGLAAVQPFFKLFFGDAFDGHGAILAVPRVAVKVRLKPAPHLVASAFRRIDVAGRLRGVRTAARGRLSVPGGAPGRSSAPAARCARTTRSTACRNGCSGGRWSQTRRSPRSRDVLTDSSSTSSTYQPLNLRPGNLS